jgi:hypothetical protein
MALAALAHAALRQASAGQERGGEVTVADVEAVARLAIQHRRPESLRSDEVSWTDDDTELVKSPPQD